ncbi:alpha/beta hydrolase [Okibacterium fritillariae]|uniref:Phospholipase/carboxylesterase n=1 Tax=Okibacterium fritillariae TaxID=123320 RepID=A0A1T5K4X1_9MICO|nr:alpha/beta hydrolase-fold protein [Okibacterium fritillariae]SKC58519.1 phospholipase/carboxylesterase [Okibacterium fritillariae]
MDDVRIDESAVLWSAGPQQRAGRPLLVILHGYGSNEADLFSLSPYLPLSPVIASLRAPFTAPWPVDGYSWFRLRQRADVSIPGLPADDAVDPAVHADSVAADHAAALDTDGVAPRVPVVAADATPEASIDAVVAWLDALETPPAQIGLLGFSQGGVMAIELMRRQPERFSFVVNLSGFVYEGEHEGDVALAESLPPVFWGRGTLDEVITEAAIVRTTDWLPAHSTLSGRIYEGLGHAVSPQELTDVAGFVERGFAA